MFEANPPPARSDINLYFDIVSPFSYFAFTVAQHYAPIWRSQGYAVHYIPVFQAAIMQGSGNSPPMSNPAKGRMSSLDAQRWARLLGIKNFSTPRKFPVSSIHCARILAVIRRYHLAKMPAAMAALWEGYWTSNANQNNRSTASSADAKSRPADHDMDISSQEDLKIMLGRVFTGAEIDIMLKLSRSEHFKYVVRENTTKVVADGCFGCPWLEVVKESGDTAHFFGNDRWLHLVQFAGLQWDGYAVVGGGEKSCI